jgi:lipoate-protein ligase B
MKLENWGLIHYEAACRRQLEAVDAVAGGAEERLIVCAHPPVVTIGRGTPPEDIVSWQGETIESSRGGRATYHGPSQVLVYPIVDLQQSRSRVPSKDVHAYLRAVELATVLALDELGVKAEARTTKMGELSVTGVWVGDKKIASIGVAVKQWITYHGMAVNVRKDVRAFQGIKPCGFEPSVMTSVEELLGKALEPRVCNWVFAKTFLSVLEP